MSFRRIRSRRAGSGFKTENTSRGRRTRRVSFDPLEQLEVRLAPATLVVNSFADNITDTSHLTLRDAITLVNNGGQSTSLGQSTMPAGWNSQISNGAFGTNDMINFSSALNGTTITLNGTALSISSNVTIAGPGANELAISGNNSSLIFQVAQGAQVALSGLTLEMGAGNVVTSGSSAMINGTPAPATNTSGGAISNAGTLTVSQAVLTNNIAAGLYSFGGAIFNTGTLNLSTSTLSGNAAADAANWGGGGAIFNTGTVSLTNSTLYNNSVTPVGTVTGLGTSTSPGGGGAIDNLGSLTVVDSTLAGNTAPTGGGIDSATSGQLVLKNTIVATNTATTAPDVSGVASGNNNLIGSSSGLSGISNNDAGHDLVGSTSIPLNPLLGAPANYGGQIPTLALLTGSPAIGAGLASSIASDQRGSSRPTAGKSDIGAFETQALASFGVSAPSVVIAGVAFPVTITARDQGGNPVTNYNGSVTLTSSDSQNVFLSAASINLANGTATVQVTLQNPSTLTLTAAAPNFTGTSGSITVSPAVASFAISVPTTAVAGTAFPVTITAENLLGNTVSYNGPVTLSSSDGQPILGVPASITLSGGTAQVTATLDKANANGVTFTASAGSVQSTSSAITVSPAAATTFTVTAPSTAGAGEAFAVTVVAKDAYGNVATGFSGTVSYSSSDGQTPTVGPSAQAWSNGTVSSTLTLANPNLNPITLTAKAGGVSGTTSLNIESTASGAISTGLTALVSWAGNQGFPLVGTATAIQNALQVGLLNPINTWLATNTPTTTTSITSFVNMLKGLSTQVGNLTATVASNSVSETTSGSNYVFTLDFKATDTTTTSLGNLGIQAQELGINLNAATQVDVTTSLNFNFSFGVNLTSGLTAAQAFFLNVPAGGLSATVAMNAANINGGITIGFLGASANNGTAQMSATLANAAALSNLSISGLQSLTLAPSGSVSVVLPLTAQLGSQSASGTLSISSANLATTAPAVQFQGFSGWQNFSTVGPQSVMSMLDQLASQLGQIGQQLWSTELPFLPSLSLAQAANLEQAFQTEITNQISYWSDALQQTVTDFNTAQDLANVLAQVLDVSASTINVQFNPTTNALTYTLPFTSYTFSSLLAQTLQVNLNQGGLANASFGASELSLVPKMTANLTFGVNLTPLGQGFVLSPTSTLSSLNGGAGVRINGSSADLHITLSNGTGFNVSLSGAKTVQAVMNDIQTASGGTVTVGIDSTSGQALVLTEVTPPAANASSTAPIFTVAAINSSYAGADLGILGADVEGIGVITGQSLSGDSLQKHFFIESATLAANVVGTVSQANATADFGAVGLTMSNGSGSIQVQGSLSITNATTFDQIAKALKGTTSLSSLASPQVSGTAQLALPLALALSVPIPGVTLPNGAEVAVNWTNITQPSTLSVTVTPALNFGNLTLAPVLQGIQNVETFVQNAGASLLSQQLPGLGTNLIQVVNPAALLSAAIGSLNVSAPVTIDQLVSQLNTLLGEPVTASFTNNVLTLGLNYAFKTTQNANLGFTLSPTLGSIADLNGSAPVSLTITANVFMGLEIDFSQPSNPPVYLQDSSSVSVGAFVSASGIAFNATVGPLGLSIENGTVRLDNGNQQQPGPATWTVGLAHSSANDLWLLSNAANQINSAIQGEVSINLPVYFPTPDQSLGNISLVVSSLQNPTTTTTLTVPNLTAAMGTVNLNGIMDEAVDGWDGLMRTLESALTQEINVASIPVVGKQLQQALNFLQTMDQTVSQILENDPQLDGSIVQDAIYQALGPPGLNWLVDLTPGGSNQEQNYVQLDQTSGSDHYLIKLHENLVAISTPLSVNLGLSGLGLQINGNLGLNAGFDATLGFGLSQQYGFYVDSIDTAAVSFSAQLPSSATATLGFLQFKVSNNTPLTPQVWGSLNLGLNNIYGTNRLSLDDLASTSAYSLNLNANANVNLHLDATIAGNTNLPHISTDFYLTWSSNPTAANPDGLGFNNVTFDLGGFLDGIANEIGQILAPIKPLAEVLTAPLPVLSQLAGHNVDLVDLATALGLCSQGTGDFINEVLSFVNDDGFNVPTSMDLGNFTLNLSAAENPASLGNLNPATTTIASTYTGNPVTGFQIPILSNPASAFQLLLGKNVPLITYETPLLQLNFAFSQFFPIIGPLGADLAGEIGAQAQFGFGFDTTGFQQYAADDFRDPSLILDGLYVSDRQNPDGTGPVAPQVELYGSIAAYAALDLGIFSAGVGGGLFASVDFTVHDPSGTGLVHLQDLEADVQKGTIFDASGALQAFLAAFVTIDLGFFSHTWNFNIASVTLATIGEPSSTDPADIPQLATPEPNGVLRLNIGPYASQRLFASATNNSRAIDGNETLTVTQVPGKPSSVYVSGFGVTNQEYDNVSEITGVGALGSDNITISAGSAINVNLAVGGGNNTIDVQSAGNVTLTGGAGTDLLEVDSATSADIVGGSGTETLKDTGGGAATLLAGGGNDELYAGTGAGQVLYGASGTNLLVGGSGNAQILHGGSGTSTLVGGSGSSQQLLGETSTATIFGGAGSGQTLTAGSGNDYLYAGEADGQVLLGGSGTDVLQVGWSLPTPGAAITFNNLPFGAIDATTSKPLQPGWHLQETHSANGWAVTNYTPGDTNRGANHGYLMEAGTGNTLIIGGWGNNTIEGGSGNDTLYGGGGSGNELMLAGVGATQMYGGGPSGIPGPSTIQGYPGYNVIIPSLGGHTLYGGSGNDELYGGDGINITVNPNGIGLVAPGGDGADQGLNVLLAGSGDNTMYSDSTGFNESTLIAGSGLDKLFAGGDAGDYLEAGSGIDSLYGGTGSDVFQLPFITPGAQSTTPDSMYGGFGLTTLVLKPVETEIQNGQLTQVSLTQDSDIYLNSVANAPNEFTASLSDLDSGVLKGQVQFTMPNSVQRIALMGGIGDNLIDVDPSVQRGILLYGGTGHNILMAGSGNDVLVGGAGTSVLEGDNGKHVGAPGDDVLYGGAIPAVYQSLIQTLGAGSTAPTSSSAPTSNALMTWLRQQPTGHNYLIGGAGSSELYAGNGGDLLIGGNATFNSQTDQFTLQVGAGRDVLEGGAGNDLMIGGLGAAGDVMFAGTGNDVLLGGAGENVLEGPEGGGGGSDVLIGGSLINVMLSNDASNATTYLLGGSGLNFELAGAGNDSLFDYSNANDPLQAPAWSQVNALATLYHVVLPQAAPAQVTNPEQEYQTLEYAQSVLSAQVALLNTLDEYPTYTGVITGDSTTISNVYSTQLMATTTVGQYYISGVNTTNLVQGEMVTGTGIPAGATVQNPITSSSFDLSLAVTGSVSGQVNQEQLTFTNPIVTAPIWETGNVSNNTVTGLTQVTIQGMTNKSNAITGLASTSSLQIGDTVTGNGIPSGTTIVQISNQTEIMLSAAATTDTAITGTTEPLSFSSPLMAGEPVSGPGIPAGTFITSVSGTQITLSNSVSPSEMGVTLGFGTVPFAGPLVSVAGAAGDLPANDSVNSVAPSYQSGVWSTSVTLAQPASQLQAIQTPTTVTLTFSLTPQEEQDREVLNNELAQILAAEQNAKKAQGATAEIDFLQGGLGNDSLYAGAAPVWMVGGAGTSATPAVYGHDTFYITPANYADFYNSTAYVENQPIPTLDAIDGNGAGTDTLMFLGDGNITLGYNSTTSAQLPGNADVVTFNNTTLAWVEGHNISTIGVQTLGGGDTITVGQAGSNGFGTKPSPSAKLGSWTSAIRIVDGGYANIPGLRGNVTIDDTAFTEQATLLGGAGNDTIMIDNMAFGSLVEGGTGNNQFNELEIDGVSNPVDIFEGINNLIGSTNFGNEDLAIDGTTFIGAANFQELVVFGYTLPPNTTVTGGPPVNVVQVNGNLIPESIIEGGSGTGVTNQFTAYDGTNTMVGGGGTGAVNDFIAESGTNTMIGGGGTNNFTASGGTTTMFGGSGANTMTVSGGTGTLLGGSGANIYKFSGAGTYSAVGGTGTNTFNVSSGTISITGGAGNNAYNLTGPGTYSILGGAGSNALDVVCQIEYDGVNLYQTGSTITFEGTINGASLNATASNMTSVRVDGSQAGGNSLDASGMTTMGVYLIGYGLYNDVYGGTGPDTLIGGSGYDYLDAGNDSDLFYVSGNYSDYVGTGDNTLVYPAQPGDSKIVVYGNGLLINGQLENGTGNGQNGYQSGQPFTYLGGPNERFIWFGYLTGVGNVDIQDSGTGTTTARAASWSDIPEYETYYVNWSDDATIWSGTWSDSGIGSYDWNYDWTSPSTPWIWYSNPNPNSADVDMSYSWSDSWNGASQPNVAGFSFVDFGTWPNYAYGIAFSLSGSVGNPGGFLGIGSYTGSMSFTLTIYGYPSYTYWTDNSSYSPWYYGVEVEPGVNVSNLTATASSTSGATVTFPPSFSTGGANPTALSYYELSPSGTQIPVTSGLTIFPIGTTDVFATATDMGGNSSTGSFDVTVLPLDVSQDATQIFVTAPSSASVYGQPETFVATVVDSNPDAGPPTGTLTFMDGTATLGTGTLSTDDDVTTASLTTITVPVGSNAITAVYNDSYGLTDTSVAVPYSVMQDTTTTAVTAAPTTSVYGQSVTFTATVAVSSPGAGTPTGTMTFMDGTNTLGTGTLITTGGVTTAAFTTTALAVGAHSIKAVYGGDTNDITSTSTAVTFNVGQNSTTTTVASARSTTVYGQSETFTATVAISGAGTGPPTGTVTFMDGTTTLGTGALSTTGGLTTASFTITALAVGAHSITAVYGGDTNDVTSTSSALSINVSQNATTTTVAAAPSGGTVYGQSATFKVTVAISGAGTGPPTGTVTFMDGTTTLGPGTLSTTGGVTTATFTTTTLAVGSHSITAVYVGDTDDMPSTSAALAFNVTQDTTTTTIATSAAAPYYHQSTMFTATIGVVSPGKGAPTGTVSFYDGSTLLGTGTLGTSGGVTTATLAISTLAVGTHSITAQYSGDTNDLKSTSGGLTLTINSLIGDTTTQGNWINTYGTSGYEVISGSNSYVKLPAGVTVTPAGQSSYTWATPANTATQALEVPPSGATRIASVWYSATSFTVDVNISSGQSYNLELYVLDYDAERRSEQIQLSNQATGVVLSTGSVSSFANGVYLTYQISGNTLITFTNKGQANAVLNGLFFDPATPAKSTPTITWTAPTNIVYGTALSSTQLDAMASVPGAFTYTPAAGTVLKAGNNQTLSVTFTPTDTTDYTSATASASINVLPATPTLTWSKPTNIVYGTALSGSQLDATSSWTVGGVAGSVAGTFSYTPAVGTVLGAGNNQTLSVIFTPTDTTDFSSATDTVAINVLPTAPTITWTNPASIVAGTALSGTQLDATSSWTVGGVLGSLAGTFTYTPASGTVLGVGNNQTLSVSFAPTDSTDFTTASGTVQINVTAPATGTSATFLKQDTTTHGNWINTYGSSGYEVISSGNSYINLPAGVTVTPAGQSSYAWPTPPSTATQALEVPPGGATRIASVWYSATSFTVDVNISSGQSYNLELYVLDYDAKGRSEQIQLANQATGAVLSTQSVSSFSAGVYLNWTISGNVLITFTNKGGTNAVLNGLFFDPATTSKSTPTITWAAPANIVYGTALSSTQLDATASVPGTFTYAPAAGTVLKAGNAQSLSVSFTPNDTTDYSSATDTVAINVLAATPTITWANPASIVAGTALSSTQLDATAGWTVGGVAGSVAGTFTYTPASGTVLGVGNNQTLSVSFAPTDSTDFTTASGTVQINVTAPATGTSATFLKQDTTTHGNWINTYGSSGYEVISSGNSYINLPAGVTVTPAGQSSYAWPTPPSTATQALEVPPGGATRIASVWYSATSFTVDVNISSGQSYNLELYVLDYDAKGRSEQIQLANQATGAVLSTQSVSSFSGGVYLNWTISGNVLITFTNKGGTNAVLNGLFFDPATTSKTTPTITWAAPANIVYGTALSSTQLDATASVPGTFTYTPAAGTVLKAGNAQSLSVSFTPNDTTDYSSATDTVAINVLPATPTITWANPASIVAGTALSSTQLDATAGWTVGGVAGSVAGTFTYTPASGTVLGVGNNQTLSVSFAPTDSTDFTTASGTVQINVTAPATGTSATFLKQDTTTHGNWINTYGSSGYEVISSGNSYINLPAGVTVTPAGQSSYTWAAPPSTATQALEVPPGGATRIASVWYSATSFTVDVNIPSGQSYNLELYVLDYDAKGRSEQIQLSNQATGAVLSTQSVSSFSAGVYLNWTISGNVLITFTNKGGTNAVLNGLFFDPAIGAEGEMAIASAGAGDGENTSVTAYGTLDLSNPNTAGNSGKPPASAPRIVKGVGGESGSGATINPPGAEVDLVLEALAADANVPSLTTDTSTHDMALEQVSEFGWGRRVRHS